MWHSIVRYFRSPSSGDDAAYADGLYLPPWVCDPGLSRHADHLARYGETFGRRETAKREAGQGGRGSRGRRRRRSATGRLGRKRRTGHCWLSMRPGCLLLRSRRISITGVASGRSSSTWPSWGRPEAFSNLIVRENLDPNGPNPNPACGRGKRPAGGCFASASRRLGRRDTPQSLM
jgi:hypothetical protein